MDPVGAWRALAGVGERGDFTVGAAAGTPFGPTPPARAAGILQ
ncbi:hypothetical protein [Streptomyces sp. SP18CS02]|nr:hypothetical protein [Streptomyces sp. SP18CS02]MEE1752848.1 hypothetical protein [Streptomyces sp. SP18CS02]